MQNMVNNHTNKKEKSDFAFGSVFLFLKKEKTLDFLGKNTIYCIGMFFVVLYIVIWQCKDLS